MMDEECLTPAKCAQGVVTVHAFGDRRSTQVGDSPREPVARRLLCVRVDPVFLVESLPLRATTLQIGLQL